MLNPRNESGNNTVSLNSLILSYAINYCLYFSHIFSLYLSHVNYCFFIAKYEFIHNVFQQFVHIMSYYSAIT